MCEIIEFEAVYKTASIKGYVLADEIDDKDCVHYYDDQGLETAQFPISAGTEDLDELHLYEAFITDDLFLQCLADYCNESKTLKRGDYTLHINGGTQYVLVRNPHDGRYKVVKKGKEFGTAFADSNIIEEALEHAESVFGITNVEVLV